MAVSIDWGTKVISVPKADLTLVQSTPYEIREMDLDWFRRQLKDLEDGPEGIWSLDTHRHNTTATLAGITFARLVEIINGYTVTFEDGQYGVNVVGGNSNIMDGLNPNQVSVRTANSAGLITTGGADPGDIADAVDLKVFAHLIEAGLDFRGSQRLVAAGIAALLSGATGGTADEWIEIRNAIANDKVRIRALVDQYGNRKQIICDLSD